MPDNQTFAFGIFDQKNRFHFLTLVQSKTEYFPFKTYKISEQQINPKVLSVTSSCHYNGNFKTAKIVYGQMPALGSYPNKSPLPGQKLKCKSPKVGTNFLCKSLGVRGGMVMDEINTCIIIPRPKFEKD